MFGGAFDPPHVAHLALARAALAQLELDELRVIPTGDAWHKSRPLSPAADRLKMAELAFAGMARVRVDDRELRRTGPSYTVDTLQALHAELPGCTLFLLIGADQWAAFESWHRWRDILALAAVCVAQRPQSAGLTTQSTVEVPTPVPFEVPASWPDSAQVRRLDMPAMPVSATAIRRHLSSLGSLSSHTSTQAPAAVSDPLLAGVLPEAVARYISLHGLYQARPSS